MSIRAQFAAKPAVTPTAASAQSGLLQRKCACGSANSSSKCEECKKDPGVLQRRARSNAGGDAGSVPPIVHEVLCSPGQPLDASARALFEPRFGHDFSKVRVHTNNRAAQSASAVNALAYTVGSDVVFAQGLYSPESDAGRGLLAHELTHIVQNRGVTAGGQIELGSISSEAEREANAVGAGARPGAVQSEGSVLRRQQAGPGKPQSCSGWTCLANLNHCDRPDPGKEGNGQPSKSWMLTVLIDVDVPTAPEVGPTTFGHSYVKFSESNGAEYTFGFYPRSQAEVVFGGTKETPGCIVHPDVTHTPCIDYEEKYSLQKPEYDSALDNAKKWCHASPGYHLFNANCTTFVAKVAESAGKTLPSYRGKVSKAGVTADNPNTLLESLQTRDKASEQARQSKERLLAEEQRLARQQKQTEILQELRQVAPQNPRVDPQQAPPTLLVPPGTQQAPPLFNPLPGAPVRGPLDDARDAVAKGKAETLKLIARGERLSSSSSQDEVNAFKKDEHVWRLVVTYWLNYFKDRGPDEGRSGYDELLNSDKFGGRLKHLRSTFGGD